MAAVRPGGDPRRRRRAAARLDRLPDRRLRQHPAAAHRVQEHYTDPDLVRPPLDVTFRDYLAAERRLRGTRRYERDQAYWFDRIDTLPAAPDLPVLGDPSAGDPVRFRRHELRLGGAGYAALREAAAAHGSARPRRSSPRTPR
ncbi:hypothetical protein V2I01_41960 [Micromonospora sp. BRA006-A]|nr:hypothetical protein [Micromonospora sp. BRA006-A]